MTTVLNLHLKLKEKKCSMIEKKWLKHLMTQRRKIAILLMGLQDLKLEKEKILTKRIKSQVE